MNREFFNNYAIEPENTDASPTGPSLRTTSGYSKQSGRTRRKTLKFIYLIAIYAAGRPVLEGAATIGQPQIKNDEILAQF